MGHAVVAVVQFLYSIQNIVSFVRLALHRRSIFRPQSLNASDATYRMHKKRKVAVAGKIRNVLHARNVTRKHFFITTTTLTI